MENKNKFYFDNRQLRYKISWKTYFQIEFHQPMQGLILGGNLAHNTRTPKQPTTPPRLGRLLTTSIVGILTTSIPPV